MIVIAAWPVLLGALPAEAQLQRTPVVEGEVSPEQVTGEEFDLPLSAADARRIDALLADLGAPEFARREQARNELVQFGAAALGKMRDAYRNSTDLEVRLSLEDIMRNVYLNHHLLDANGFLGIRHRPPEVHRARDPRVPPDGVGIVIDFVLPGTAAERFGLQEGDMIIGVDGEPIPMSRRGFSVDGFGEAIRKRGPGARAVFTVVRRNQTFDVEIEIGRRPEDTYSDQDGLRSDLYAVRERFAIWWDKFVRPAESADEAALDSASSVDGG